MTILKREDLTQEKWLEKLHQLNFSAEESAWMIVEKPWECYLDYFSPTLITAESYRGRIFSTSGEWKWRFLPGIGYRCVFLGETDWSLLSQDDSNQLISLESKRKEIVLWGEYHKKEEIWIESKIPRRLKYPVSNPDRRSRVVLAVEEWQNSDGKTTFVRYREIK